ncbi:WXG100 family type VII secretion target [Pseudonocardia endophytica]|uniref:PE family protein n=1 Tax=Pseudonocardia endophytica TaxID=401976 RepID=A0A4R1HFN0_PSEEN|nr:hypothetical protein [Pseudonocardia endophytica]TCK20478.1 hypothetical protein EV378_4437 [Pseudonocardia endophytica]
MPDSPAPDLRVDPHELPRLRSAVDAALERVDASLRTLESNARLPRPWLGDPVSARAAADYARGSTDGPSAAVAALRAYRDELVRVRDSMGASGRTYAGTEDAVASSFGSAR